MDSERKDLPARGAWKDGHPWDTLRMQRQVGLPLWPHLGPESKSWIQLPAHVGTRSADAVVFSNELDLQSPKWFQIHAGKWGVVSWAPSGPRRLESLECMVHRWIKMALGK